MIDSAGFTDLRNYIKRRVAYAKYRVGNTYIKTDLSDVAVLPNGTVRAQLTISAESTPLTVTRVELYNSDNALWAHQDCSITVNTGQTGILYWFDFTVTEQVVKKLLAKDAKPTQNYALSVITSYRGLFKDVTSDAFLEKMLDEFVLSRPALEA